MFISIPGGRDNLYSLKRYARMYVILSNKGATEQQLDRVIFDKYNMTLVGACRMLIDRATYSASGKNELIIAFPTKYLDDLATLITYGNGKAQGSRILLKAFKGY